MGEAKRKREARQEAFKRHLLREAEMWSSPATADEARVVAAITSLPRVRATRLPADRLRLMGMRPRECFANCGWYADGEPGRRVRLGWLSDQFGIFVLHAVIEENGRLTCITPSVTGAPDEFDFISDSAVKMAHGGEGHVRFERDGVPIAHGVRADPERMIARMTAMRDALLAGTDPSRLPAWDA